MKNEEQVAGTTGLGKKVVRCRMLIEDVVLTAPNGMKFDLHYRVLGRNRDHFSGFLRKQDSNWARNCAISIPIVYGEEEFHGIVDSILANADKFNASNTVGRPRYFDILKDGIAGLKDSNLIQDLVQHHPDFHTVQNSCRKWTFRTIAGNFNMRSIKINSVKFNTTVSFRNLMEYIKDPDIHELVRNLSRKTFEFEKEFVDFSNQFIDATHETFVVAYNDYMGSLIGTVTHKPVRLKNGDFRDHYTMYVPTIDKDSPASVAAYNAAYSQCLSRLPKGLNKRDVTVVPCVLMETVEVASAAVKLRKAELVKRLNEAMEASRIARTKMNGGTK